jgi:hypothetical protein
MASGNTLIIFTPLNNEPPVANFATLDTRNGRVCLDYDDTTDEHAIFRGVLPRHYSGGGITVYLIWRATSATSGSVRWATSFERGNTDIDTDSFAGGQNTGGTVNGTSGISTTTSISHTDGASIDSLAVGEEFYLKVSRDADGTSGTDDATGDAELYTVELKET